MGEKTGIEWTNHTFNPLWGCTKIASPDPAGSACDGCYAETWARRFGVVWGPHGTFREFGDNHWNEPLRWDRAAAAAGVRARVFCASMADVFDNRWPPGVRDRLWALIRATPWLDWQLLTKRPQNIARMLPPDWGDGYPNVWLGVTVENQTEANRRIPVLRAVPATVHFLSMEPLLGPVVSAPALNGIDWIIAGGESGHAARPSHPDWYRALRDECAAAGVPFFFKQWGSLMPVGPIDRGEATGPSEYAWQRVDKKVAGNLLDGRQHQDMPKARAA